MPPPSTTSTSPVKQPQPSQPNGRRMMLDARDNSALYGLYKQASMGDAPKRSVAFCSPLHQARRKVWSRVSRNVPDEALEEAFGHVQAAIQILRDNEKPPEPAEQSPSSNRRQTWHPYHQNQNPQPQDSPGAGAPVKPSTKSFRNWSLRAVRRFSQRSSTAHAPSTTSSEAGVQEGANRATTEEETITAEEMLLLAAAEDDELTVRTLLEERKEMNVDFRDELGQTALHICADRGHLGTAVALIDQGADIEAADNDGISVLQAAVISGHVPICKELLVRGADPDKADQDGDTPRLCAMDDGSVELRDLFGDKKSGQGNDDGEDEDDEDDDEDEEDAPHAVGGEQEEEEESVISWTTDFTELKNVRLVDRLPSDFGKKKAVPPAAANNNKKNQKKGVAAA